MPIREFTGIDLPRMMEHATNYKPDIEDGRWRVETRFQEQPWEVIVEPVRKKKLLVVVTAYDAN